MHLTKKWQRILYALAIATLMLLAILLLTHIAFGGRETKLSSGAACMAVQPRVSKAAPWMAAVWIEDNEECSAKGKAMLQAAQYDAGSKTYIWWTAPFVVENGSASAACVTHADVVIKDGVAHIVFDKRNPCQDGTSNIYYRKYDLATQNLLSEGRIDGIGGTQSVADVGITLDSSGLAHVVYNPNGGDILYKKQQSDGSWDLSVVGTTLSVTSTELPIDYPAYHPRIA